MVETPVEPPAADPGLIARGAFTGIKVHDVPGGAVQDLMFTSNGTLWYARNEAGLDATLVDTRHACNHGAGPGWLDLWTTDLGHEVRMQDVDVFCVHQESATPGVPFKLETRHYVFDVNQQLVAIGLYDEAILQRDHLKGDGRLWGFSSLVLRESFPLLGAPFTECRAGIVDTGTYNFSVHRAVSADECFVTGALLTTGVPIGDTRLAGGMFWFGERTMSAFHVAHSRGTGGIHEWRNDSSTFAGAPLSKGAVAQISYGIRTAMIGLGPDGESLEVFSRTDDPTTGSPATTIDMQIPLAGRVIDFTTADVDGNGWSEVYVQVDDGQDARFLDLTGGKLALDERVLGLRFTEAVHIDWDDDGVLDLVYSDGAQLRWGPARGV